MGNSYQALSALVTAASRLSYRQIATSQDVGYGTVTNYIKRAKAAGVSWPLPPECGERELSALLFPSASQRRDTTFVEPDLRPLR